MKNKDLKKRIIDISYKKGLAHIGSCLTAVDIIEDIYQKIDKEHIADINASAKRNDTPNSAVEGRFILSSGHAGLALYVVLEKKYQWETRCFWDKELGAVVHSGINDAEKMFDHHGVHPDKCMRCGISCSTGSLGQGLPISVGMALANRKRKIHCLISDGECAEGSIWEALRLKTELQLDNLEVHVNYNGWGAYDTVNREELLERLDVFSNVFFHDADTSWYPDWLQGQMAHYKVMTSEQYKEIIDIIDK